MTIVFFYWFHGCVFFIRSTLFIRIRFAYFKRHNDACCLLHRQFHFHRVDKNFTSLDLISFGAKDKRFPLQLTAISWILFAFLCASCALCFFSFLFFTFEWIFKSFHTFNKLFVDWDKMCTAINSTCSKPIQSQHTNGVHLMQNNKIMRATKKRQKEKCFQNSGRQLFEESSNFSHQWNGPEKNSITSQSGLKLWAIMSCSIHDKRFYFVCIFVIYSGEFITRMPISLLARPVFSSYAALLLPLEYTCACWCSNLITVGCLQKHKNVNTKFILIYFFIVYLLLLIDWKSCARQLDDNAVMHLDDISLAQLKSLRALRLEGNMLQRVPTEALTGLPTLEILWVCLFKSNFQFSSLIFLYAFYLHWEYCFYSHSSFSVY